LWERAVPAALRQDPEVVTVYNRLNRIGLDYNALWNPGHDFAENDDVHAWERKRTFAWDWAADSDYSDADWGHFPIWYNLSDWHDFGYY
jgi:hypothetical protein